MTMFDLIPAHGQAVLSLVGLVGLGMGLWIGLVCWGSRRNWW